MELDWRNRCVGGERLEELYEVVAALAVGTDDELFDAVWNHPQAALAFHRAIMRIAAELLWQRAARLAPWQVLDPHRVESLMRDAFDELGRRAGIELDRAQRPTTAI